MTLPLESVGQGSVTLLETSSDCVMVLGHGFCPFEFLFFHVFLSRFFFHDFVFHHFLFRHLFFMFFVSYFFVAILFFMFFFRDQFL